MITKPRGTEDVLPQDTGLWQEVEKIAWECCKVFGYKEIRTPVFESTELFERGVGDTTDVVQKEMYTFLDKGGRSMTLKPEATATLVRSYIENSLYANPQPTKLGYIIPCFRYEKPQSGRLREFHQFGVECFGAGTAETDAELISLASVFLNKVGIEGVKLYINSIGCPTCRKIYNEELKKYFKAREDELCDTCRERLEKNPMRIIDCKSPICSEIGKDAPRMVEFLCDECKTHFEEVQDRLTNMGIKFTVNPDIVRGLDYYTKTVFEFVSDFSSLGNQSTVCGGGRYSGLVEQLGGKPTEGIGFAIGLERLIFILKNQKKFLKTENGPEIFLVAIGEESVKKAQKIVYELRCRGVYAEMDLCGRSVKAQMKYANKIYADYSAVIGDDELKENNVFVKNMKTGEQTEMELTSTAVYDFIREEL